MKTRCCSLGLLCCFIPLFGVFSSAGAAPPAPVFKPDVIAHIRNAAQIEVFRVRTLHASPAGIEVPGPEVKMMGRLVVLKQGNTQGADFAKRLASLLTDIQKCSGPGLMCGFRPGVVYQIPEPQGTIQVVFCFYCDEVQVTEKNKAGAKVDERYIFFSGPRRKAAIALARMVFPEDTDLSQLVGQ